MLLSLPGLLHAQPAAPLRLAIVSEAGTPPELADLLTVELSQKPALQLVERDQVARVYREQSLAGQGRDSLQLGRLLNADGLLLLTVAGSGTNRALHSRLLAVKPGVLISSTRSPVSNPEPARWASWLASHFEPLLSKLGVAATDAIPLSVVNLRAAVASDSSRDLERQLTLLAIERLTLDRRLFILERRRLDLLAAEKDLQPADDSAFWNGRYLLEGTIDRDGSSPDTLTLDARLVGPGGGSSTAISLKGPRDQLPTLIDRLAARVLEVLQRPAEPTPWKPEAEAAKFFEEARWALKWNMVPEAQSAADSAWALGKRDLDTALLQVRSLLPDLGPFQFPRGSSPVKLERTAFEAGYRALLNRNPGSLARISTNGSKVEVEVVYSSRPPTGAQIEKASRAVRLYAQFTQTLPLTEPKPDSEWYLAGLDALAGAGEVLQGALLAPSIIETHREDLAELRADARRAVDRILKSTSVRHDYWTGERIAPGFELATRIRHKPNLFASLVQWGPFFQDTPEACIEQWRLLMDSPVFAYCHEAFWVREPAHPQVIGWTPADRLRAHGIWQSFVSELSGSPRFLLKMEGLALQIVAIRDRPGRDARFADLLEVLRSHRADIVQHDVDLMNNLWGLLRLDGLADAMGLHPTGRISPELKEDIRAMEAEWQRTRDQRTQKRTVTAAPNPGTPVSAVPISTAPVTNSGYTNSASTNSPVAQARPYPFPPRALRTTGPTNVVNDRSNATPAAVPSEVPLDRLPLLTGGQFVSIPKVIFSKRRPPFRILNAILDDVRVSEDAVWVDVRSSLYEWVETRPLVLSEQLFEYAAWARWDRKTDAWSLIAEMPIPSRNGPVVRPSSRWLGETLYVSDWNSIRAWSSSGAALPTIDMPWQAPPRLFAVHQRLFAASEDGIYEVPTSGGGGVRVLASTRRRPAVTPLDALEKFEKPTLFEGPDGSMVAHVGERLHRWTGKEWLPHFPHPVQGVREGGGVAVLRGYMENIVAAVWLLPLQKPDPLLALRWHRSDYGAPKLGLPAHMSPLRPPPLPSGPNAPGGLPAWNLAHLHSGSRVEFVPWADGLLAYVDETPELDIPVATPAGKTAPTHHALLSVLTPALKTAKTLRLQFDPQKGAVPSSSKRLSPGSGQATDYRLHLRTTRNDLFVFHPSNMGFWMIPRAEIEAAAKSAP